MLIERKRPRDFACASIGAIMFRDVLFSAPTISPKVRDFLVANARAELLG